MTCQPCTPKFCGRARTGSEVASRTCKRAFYAWTLELKVMRRCLRPVIYANLHSGERNTYYRYKTCMSSKYNEQKWNAWDMTLKQASQFTLIQRSYVRLKRHGLVDALRRLHQAPLCSSSHAQLLILHTWLTSLACIKQQRPP